MPRGTGRSWPDIIGEKKKKIYTLGIIAIIMMCAGIVLLLSDFGFVSLLPLAMGILLLAYLAKISM
jgi:hypothetical protein